MSTETVTIGIDDVTIYMASLGVYYYSVEESVDFPLNEFGHIIYGNDASYTSETIIGYIGDDTIYGLKGSDFIYGGAGDDYIDGGIDYGELYGDEGNDTLYNGWISYGGDGDDSIIGTHILYGEAGNDYLQSGGSNDTLDGGTGIDTMIGGLKNDLYFVDNVEDIVVENPDEGSDEIRSSVSYNLNDSDRCVEILRLTGSLDIDSTGNNYSNTLIGNSGINSLLGLAGNDTLYGGAGDDLIDGGSGADLIDGGEGADIMFGGLGNDTIVVDDQNDIVIEYSNEGVDEIQAFISYTLTNDCNFENLTLNEDSIYGVGNDFDNFITSNSRYNTLEGGLGNDILSSNNYFCTMLGGVGDDVYRTIAADEIIEYANEGIDTVQTISDNYTLPDNVEILIMEESGTGQGNSLDNILIASAKGNSLKGGAGNDYLQGKDGNDALYGDAGVDTLVGGKGNDIYYVDQYFDEIIEYEGEGYDQVRTYVNYVMRANIEKGEIKSTSDITLVGNELNNLLNGGSGKNTFYGEAGNDTINGGAGQDTMYGGYGDDTFYIDRDNDDIVIEFYNQGTDKVISYRNYTMADNIEILELQDYAEVGIGNSSENIIIGNVIKSNILNGGKGLDTIYGRDYDDTIDGGQHIDSMIGGKGNDTYYIDEYLDKVVENVDEGTDLIYSTTHYDLSKNAENVENLILLGDTNINVTGNDLHNYLTGNSGNNFFYAKSGNDTIDGGAGEDTMYGQYGDDTYYVDNVKDVVTEFYNQGNDKVISSIDYTLGAYVENLELVGSSDINATGNNLNNSIKGNSGNNILSGGSGSDIYNFSGDDGIDIITDESGTEDKINFLTDIAYSNVALFRSYNVIGEGSYIFTSDDLNIDYGSTIGNNQITVTNQFNGLQIEFIEENNIEVENPADHFLSNSDISAIVQYIAAYDSNDGVADFLSINDVKADSTLMTYISSHWQTS